MSRHDPLHNKLLRAIGTSITRYRMIGDGDRILVAVSGGKDSSALLYLLRQLQSRAPIRFELGAITIDGGWGAHAGELIRAFCNALGVPLLERQPDIVGSLEDKLGDGDTPCALCARLRRGVIYRVAREEGYPKVALGHHADDLVETLLLNMLFNGQLKGMPPLLKADDGQTTLIRPLALADEETIFNYAVRAGLPTESCDCPGETRADLRRPDIKELIIELDQRFPGSYASLCGAVTRLKETTLADPRWLPLEDPPRAAVKGPRPAAPPSPDEIRELLRPLRG